MKKLIYLIILVLACVGRAAPPPPLPSPGEIQFVPNYGGDPDLIGLWWNDGWMPNHWVLHGTRDVDPSTGTYCLLQPHGYRYVFGFDPSTGTYSVAPAKFVVIDMGNTVDDPCVDDLTRKYIPLIWHYRLVASPTFNAMPRQALLP